MSQLGQSRRFDGRPATSGLPPSTDIVRAGRQVSSVPLATSPSKARLRQHPTSWHSRAGGGAVHIKLGQRRSTSVLKRKTPAGFAGGCRSVLQKHSTADQSNAVRIPAAPPLTLMLPVFLSALPSNENTSIDLSAIDWASSVLPSLLQATPCPQAPNSAFAASVSLVPLIRKIQSALPL